MILTAEDAKDAEKMDRINNLAYNLNGAAIAVHRELGPGLLESAYEAALCHELILREIPFLRQKPVTVAYKGTEIDCGYRIDILADDRIILELKAVEKLLPLHEAQLLTYLKLSHLSLGLLINFNVPVLKDGIRRLVNNLEEPSALSASSAVKNKNLRG